MSLIPTAMLGGVPTGFEVLNSGAFAAEELDYLSKTFTSEATWTFSVWVKRANVSIALGLLEGGLHINSDNAITAVGLTTTAVFRDVSEWYHICVSNNGLEINGVNLGSVTTSALTDPDIGRNGTNYFDGYLSEVYFIDGQSLGSSNFAEEDSVTGQWNPIEYIGTYGTDGFYFNFKNGTELGEDSSGNGNDFTNSGVTQSTDTPVDNHCVLNTIDPLTTATITNSGLTSASGNAKVTMRPETGKWYYEKDGVGVNYDTGVSGQFDPVLVVGDYVFSEDDWAGTPDSGFIALSSKNFLTPDIVLPSDHFKTIAYDDGAGAKTVGFQPDLVWFKSRGSAFNHRLTDSVRGVTKAISSNDDTVEVTNLTGLTSFDVDGFTVGGSSDYSDQTGDGMVARCWKKGVTPGFDIVSYVGTAVTKTEAHSLGIVPEVMLVKNIDSIKDWAVYHKGFPGTPEQYFVEINTNDPVALASSVWNDTAPTSSVFSVGTAGRVNENLSDHIAYLFASVEGFSKFDTYEGNNSVDGPFVYLGFRPEMVIIRDVSTSATGNWVMVNAVRSLSNGIVDFLWADLASAELTGATGADVDFLSNGFKIRNTTTNNNVNGNTYAYMAFAESPFQYSRAR